MKIETTYDIGDIVFLITDEDRNPRMVTSISIRPNNQIIYDLSCGTTCTSHYEIEISTKKVGYL